MAFVANEPMGPAGPTGPTGAAGPTGPTGAAGPVGLTTSQKCERLTLQEYLDKARDAGALAQESSEVRPACCVRERSRSPRSPRQEPRYCWNLWNLGAKTARNGVFHIELNQHAQKPSFPLYVEDEWLRAYPSRFTPFSDAMLANDSSVLKLSVLLYSKEVIDLVRSFDLWVLQQVAPRAPRSFWESWPPLRPSRCDLTARSTRRIRTPLL